MQRDATRRGTIGESLGTGGIKRAPGKPVRDTKRWDVGGKRGQEKGYLSGKKERVAERTVAPVHAPGAFHNPEYCSRIHIYATSPGDNSAIMRRGRARPTWPPFRRPPRADRSLYATLTLSRDLSLLRRAWNCSSRADRRGGPVDLFNAVGKNKADVSVPVAPPTESIIKAGGGEILFVDNGPSVGRVAIY